MARRYDDGEFVGNEPERRALRDAYRDKFFSELGVERMTDPFDFAPDLAQQAELIARLAKTAANFLQGDADALDTANKVIASLKLGVASPGFQSVQNRRLNFQKLSVKALDQMFFAQRLSGF